MSTFKTINDHSNVFYPALPFTPFLKKGQYLSNTDAGNLCSDKENREPPPHLRNVKAAGKEEERRCIH